MSDTCTLHQIIANDPYLHLKVSKFLSMLDVWNEQQKYGNFASLHEFSCVDAKFRKQETIETKQHYQCKTHVSKYLSSNFQRLNQNTEFKPLRFVILKGDFLHHLWVQKFKLSHLTAKYRNWFGRSNSHGFLVTQRVIVLGSQIWWATTHLISIDK